MYIHATRLLLQAYKISTTCICEGNSNESVHITHVYLTEDTCTANGTMTDG